MSPCSLQRAAGGSSSCCKSTYPHTEINTALLLQHPSSSGSSSSSGGDGGGHHCDNAMTAACTWDAATDAAGRLAGEGEKRWRPSHGGGGRVWVGGDSERGKKGLSSTCSAQQLGDGRQYWILMLTQTRYLDPSH